MNKKHLIISVLFLITLFQLHGQKPYFGIGIEPQFLMTNKTEIFTNIHLALLLPPSKYLEIELRPGIVLPNSNFMGSEIGIFLRYFPFDENIYLIGGHKWHNNFGESGMEFEVKDDLYSMFGLGLGYRYEKLYVEGTYYNINPKEIKSIISLNIALNFEL